MVKIFKRPYKIACIDKDNESAQNWSGVQKYELMLPVMNDDVVHDKYFC